jgi:FkbM family methyltransferase
LLDSGNEKTFFIDVFEDTFFAYVQYDDCYDEAKMDFYYDLLPEGTYGLRNGLVDVTVKADDVVLDAGSWIGDFAAYASVQGALVYAFEPSVATYGYLLKTAELNKNILPVQKGLGHMKVVATFIHSPDNSGKDTAILERQADIGEQSIKITTIDTFVLENGLTRVDFIKADIEGHERYMLEGAKETLKKFAPKLAICTYHLPDDPEVLAKIIKAANPAYNIVQKRKKLYASVPDRFKRE